jgi:peptide/nickel transport system permease protein
MALAGPPCRFWPIGSSSWAYGLLIVGLSINVFNMYTMPLNRWPPGFSWSTLRFYLGNMIPAVIAIFISKFFQSVYAWRTIFLVNSSEDYVDVAKAKGMPGRVIEQRYILRPLLPNIITNFVLIMIALWQEAIILESIFSVAGIGQLFRAAVQFFDIRMIVALVVTFAYLLAISVFLLDIIYALVDRANVDFSVPRIARRESILRAERWFNWRHARRKPCCDRAANNQPKLVYASRQSNRS